MSAERFRAEALARRRAQSPVEAARLGQLISQRFLANLGATPGEASGARLPRTRWEGRHVALFRPLAEEPELRILESSFQEAGAILSFPRCVDRDLKCLEFAVVERPGDERSWTRGPYGIQEPHLRHAALDPSLLDLIVVPGVAFGPRGERIGMGAGYYDRFLPQAPQALRVSLVFDFQIFEQGLEQNPWDQPVHWILSEKREIRTPYFEQWAQGFQKAGRE